MQLVFKYPTGTAQITWFNWQCAGVIGNEPAQEICIHDQAYGHQLCKPLGDGVLLLDLSE